MVDKKNAGYILILTTFVVATSVLLVSLVVNRVNAYRHLSRLSIDREKARMLALSGLEIAMSELSVLDPKKEPSPQQEQEKTQQQQPVAQQQAVQKKDATSDAEKEIADFLLNKLNAWQTFKFQEKFDGLNGECQIHISSEHGKINVNKLFDFTKKQFVNQGTINGAKICLIINERLRGLFTKQQKKAPDFRALLERFFQNRGTPIEDVSELLTIKEFAGLQNSLFPSTQDVGLVLSDLFTVATKDLTLQPLMLTTTTRQLIGAPAKSKPHENSVKGIAELLKTPPTNWQTSWKPTMESLYTKSYEALPQEIKVLFDTKFEPELFFVVSYGKVGSATQKVAAIIEKNKASQDQQPCIIKKLYWIS